MTTLYFIPDKAGKAFIAPLPANGGSQDTTLMDVAVVDTAGLVGYVEACLGIHCSEEAFNVRLCRYYKLLRRWLDAHDGNVLCNSFRLAHLSTARQLLVWRDELKMAQWDFSFDDADSRLGALAAIEKLESVAGLPDRIIAAAARLEASDDKAFHGVRILLNVARQTLRPLLRRLLDALERRGATIAMTEFAPDKGDNLSALRRSLLSGDGGSVILNGSDDSFEVLSFETAYDEAEYIAVCQHGFNASLMVNSRAKETDNRLAAQYLPTSGSKITSRSRVLNLMPLALSLYDEHLQITKLVEWFAAPLHPLPGRFRFQLAEAIARSGGYLNSACREIVDKYIAGEYAYPDERDKQLSEAELRKLEAKRRNERLEMVALFVPYLEPGYRTDANAERTLMRLSVWARQRLHTLPEDDDREAVATQLKALSDGIDILMLLFSERDERFDLALAGEWVRDIPSEITLPQHPARVGSVFTIGRPWDIAVPASCIVWANMESEEIAPFECEFLLPSERRAIEANARFWQREDETRYRFLNSILPFLFAADRLVLTCADKRGGERIVPHPLMTRLSVQVANFKEFTRRKDISDLRDVEVEPVDNSRRVTAYSFLHPEKIRFPKRMSATALETFTLYPFDFLFERILNYQTAGLSSLPQLYTTRGNVAHAVIARLFSPPDSRHPASAAEIRQRVEMGYEAAFQDAVNECGAIFRLPENKLEMSNLHYQLRNCIDSLLEIIEVNGLKVDGCENHYSKFIDLYGDGPSGDQPDDLHGYVDMKLTDSQGRHVVFDLKWTRSRSYHQSLLEGNRSTQLAVYSHLLADGDDSVITAYFVMPRGRLLSCFPFKGRGAVRVERADDADIMEQLINSFRYRCGQLLSGVLEDGEHHPLSELAYSRDCMDRNLFPLAADDDDLKKENIFSTYRIFKGF